jgi:uncharacterized membrane protein (DUF106 family)
MIMRELRIKELEKKRDKAKVLAIEKAKEDSRKRKKFFKEVFNVLILIGVITGIGYALYYIAGKN